MKNINQASAPLAKIMEAEGATEFEMIANGGAYISPVDGEKLYVDVNRIIEAEAEIRVGAE